MMDRAALLESARYRLKEARIQLEESQAYLTWQRSPEGQASESEWVCNVAETERDVVGFGDEVAFFEGVVAVLEGKA